MEGDARFAVLVQEIHSALSQVGIYPAPVRGGPDAYENGWNAATMEMSREIGQAVARASADLDLDRLHLLTSEAIESQEDGSLLINFSDTWAWACADARRIPADKVGEVAKLYRRWGFAGLLYWETLQPDGYKRSEFRDNNRFIDFVKREEEWRQREPDSTKRAYNDIPV